MREGQARDKQGLPVTSSQRQLADWFQDWLNDTKAGTVRPRTLHHYRSRLQHVVDAMGAVRMGTLTAIHVRRFYGDLRRAGLAPVTIRSIHAVLTMSLNDAVKDGLLVANPCAKIKPPAVEAIQYTTLGVEQISHLLASEADPMWRSLWAVLATAGLRVGEAMALTWDVVDLTTGELHVNHTLVQLPGGGWELGPPKTKSSKRLVYLGTRTVALLAEWRHLQTQQKVLSRERFVFTRLDRQPLYEGLVLEHLAAALYRAKLPKLTPHELRHSAATNMLAMGINVKVVSEMLGHASVAITLNLYAHTIPAMHRDAAMRVDALL